MAALQQPAAADAAVAAAAQALTARLHQLLSLSPGSDSGSDSEATISCGHISSGSSSGGSKAAEVADLVSRLLAAAEASKSAAVQQETQRWRPLAESAVAQVNQLVSMDAAHVARAVQVAEALEQAVAREADLRAAQDALVEAKDDQIVAMKRKHAEAAAAADARCTQLEARCVQLQRSLEAAAQQRRQLSEQLQRAEAAAASAGRARAAALRRAARLAEEKRAAEASAAAAAAMAAARGLRLTTYGSYPYQLEEAKWVAVVTEGFYGGELGPFQTAEQAKLALDLVFVVRVCRQGGTPAWASGEAWEALCSTADELDDAAMQQLLEGWDGHVAVDGPPAAAFLHTAAARGSTALAKLVLALFPSSACAANAAGATACHIAAAGGHTAVVHALLDATPSVARVADSSGSFPLHSAARGGHAAAVQALLCANPQAAAAADSEAAQAGHAAAVRCLLHAAPEAVAHMDASGRTPLAQACAHGHTACAEALLLASRNVALTADEDGFMPHHLAAYGGHADALGVLLAFGPPRLATLPSTDGGWTAAHLAAQGGHQQALAAVVASAGAPALLVPSDIGWLPLHSACEFGSAGQLAVVDLLLRCAPEAAERRCPDGQLPIQVALSHGQLDAARCLLQYAPSQAVLSALRAAGEAAQPLFADFVRAPGRLPLSWAEWAQMPVLCPSLQHALPAALEHSTAQARYLVRRLRTFALVLARLQRRLRLQLPALLVQRLLSMAFEA